MSIYPPARQPTNVLNGVGDMSDGSGTINPAALNASGMPCLIGFLSRPSGRPSRPGINQALIRPALGASCFALGAATSPSLSRALLTDPAQQAD
jgi:hypothetical protein